MYLLFRYHGIMPGQFYKMGFGEKQIVRSMMIYEIKQRIKEIESMGVE